MNEILCGDSLELMKDIPNSSIDLLLTDPPYGTTAAAWDKSIDLEKFWVQARRVLKPNGTCIMTASQPFTTELASSNLPWLKYALVWNKTRGTGFFNAKNQPLKIHEDILVFSSGVSNHATRSKARMTYNPQGLKAEVSHKTNDSLVRATKRSVLLSKNYLQEFSNYPTTVLTFKHDNGLHPTQKPVALFEYLIRTYSNEEEIVLDPFAGSCTTAIAALRSKRNYICIERELSFVEIGALRVESLPKDLFATCEN
jgi:site-specific DNA-methyltransferase (adenine-specific)